jgi:hypothetical protein
MIKLELSLVEAKAIRHILKLEAAHAKKMALSTHQNCAHDSVCGMSWTGGMAAKAQEKKFLYEKLDRAIKLGTVEVPWPSLDDHLIQEAKEAFDKSPAGWDKIEGNE